MHRLLAALLLSPALLLASGCGPVQTTAWMMDAEVALASARTAGAADKAPYELTSAELYLHKAREELGYAEYEVAVDCARKATRHAQEAREKALKAAATAPAPAKAAPGKP
ncbi:MAG: DUF4398 domain-containing protein [Deltaproteobacteria bacterium]|nr:DUF4398 domain-containing protein [Deltaproteobacteria bacterium]